MTAPRWLRMDWAGWRDRVLRRTPAPSQTQKTPAVRPGEAWRALLRAFDARPLRERVLLSVAALALVIQVFDSAWLTPAWRAWSLARKAAHESQVTSDALSNSVAAVAARAQAQRLESLAELQRLRKQYGPANPPNAAAVDVGARPAPAKAAGGLVAARDMLPLLEQLLNRHGGVKIVNFQSLGQTPLGRTQAAARGPAKAASATAPADVASAPAAAGNQPIYRHGVELTLEGSYADLVAYLQAVEALPQRILWGSLRLKVEEHPRVLLTVRLYTLSLDSQWAEI